MIAKADRRSLQLLLIGFGLAGTSTILAQTRGDETAPRPRPPIEALAACQAKTEGARCSVGRPGGPMDDGTCYAPPSLQLACLPRGGPPSGGPPRPEQGVAIPATAVDTRTTLCALRSKGTNASVRLQFNARWSCSADARTLVANGVPDHPVGAFPNAGNPNPLAAQSVRFSTTLTPVARAGSGAVVKVAGYALNGIKFDPGTAQSCDTPCADRGAGHGNPWRIEALGQTFFAFGIDANHAHVQPGGAYHYHGVPEDMLSPAARAGRAMALIGWAVDGYPIYARFGHADAMELASSLRAMRPSYRLKARPDAGRPRVDFAPMGTFTQDYEFVAGLGDLDQCNGRRDVTPEFARGIYHYYATDGFPFIQRCVKGPPARVAENGPPPFGTFARPRW